jgi:hypothetical protein
MSGVGGHVFEIERLRAERQQGYLAGLFKLERLRVRHSAPHFSGTQNSGTREAANCLAFAGKLRRLI